MSRQDCYNIEAKYDGVGNRIQTSDFLFPSCALVNTIKPFAIEEIQLLHFNFNVWASRRGGTAKNLMTVLPLL